MVHATVAGPPPMRWRGGQIPRVAWTIEEESSHKVVKPSLMLVPICRTRFAPADGAGTARGSGLMLGRTATEQMRT
jgi:hypothetical protein